MKVIDLCSGLGGATQAFRDRGHEVFGIDIVPALKPDLIGDVRNLTITDFPFKPYFIWASPPCKEFSKNDKPWFPKVEPDMSIVMACIRLINELVPERWVLENVRGARPYLNPILGNPKKCKSFYLWGDYPIFDVKIKRKKQNSPKSLIRSKVPYEISKALCLALELEIDNGHALRDP